MSRQKKPHVAGEEKRKYIPKELPPIVEADFAALEAAMAAKEQGAALQPVSAGGVGTQGWKPQREGEKLFGMYLGSFRNGPRTIHKIATKREGANVTEEIVGGRTLGRALRTAGQRAFVEITYTGSTTDKRGRAHEGWAVAKL